MIFKGKEKKNMTTATKYSATQYFFYETRPFNLLLIAAYAIAYPTSPLVAIGGISLFTCTAIILRLRLKHRGYIKW